MRVNKFSEFIAINEAVDKYTYKPTNLVGEICTAMILINNKFLDSILDAGKIARYNTNTNVFLNDLKHLMSIKNRLCLGKFENNKCVEDLDSSKIKIFDSIEFKIDEDFQILIDSRVAARNIIDKLIPNDKLTEDMIEFVFWLGPNKNEEYQEDIVLQLYDGRQFSFFLNKNVTLYKTASFQKFANELIGNEFEKLFSPLYINLWNELMQFWVELIYTNANKNIQNHIEKFIDPDKIKSIQYFMYFDFEHRDPKFKNLGEYIQELDDNFLKLPDLMSAIWKNRENCFADPEMVFKKWMSKKVLILNSKILEHLLTESLTKNSIGDIEKLDDNFKLAKGKIKMKFIKTIVNKLNCKDRNIYYLGNNGNIFTMIPTRKFFREGFDFITVKFDYHVKLLVKEEERKNDFEIAIVIELDEKPLMTTDVAVNFGRKEMGGKLSCRYKFGMEPDFNERILNKMKIS
jgi:hypothetical protein